MRRQGDFRHQHDGALALVQGVLDRLQVHLGFAAAGDAEQQHHGRGVRLHGLLHQVEGGGLLGHQGQRLGGQDGLVGERIPGQDTALDTQKTLFFQRTDRGGGCAGQSDDILQQAGFSIRQGFQNGRLLGRLAAQDLQQVGGRRGGREYMDALLEAAALFAHGGGQDGLQRFFHRRGIIVRDPSRQGQELVINQHGFAHSIADFLESRMRGGFGKAHHVAAGFRGAERDDDLHAGFQQAAKAVGDKIIELAISGAFDDHFGDGGHDDDPAIYYFSGAPTSAVRLGASIGTGPLK